jgi:hypothetical protein
LRGAAIGDPGFVPGRGLVRAAHREADRAAIGMAGRLAIAIEDPPGMRQGPAGQVYLAYIRDPDGNMAPSSATAGWLRATRY